MLHSRARLSALVFCGAACLMASAGQAPQATSSDRPQYFSSNEIHIDQDCRILPDPAHTPPGKKPKPYADAAVCHLEHVYESEHVEEQIQGSQLLRWRVQIHEHEFVLQDISDTTVTFVVQQVIPKDWTVDSDPQPKQMIGQTAYFPVIVEPRQIVRLHVGMRHAIPMRSKPVAAQEPHPDARPLHSL
jgi:hypothetical protein